MSHIAPEGNVYQAGTLSGNPLAMVAGLTTLRALDESLYERLDAATGELCSGLRAAADRYGIPVQINWVCGMFSVFFTNNPVTAFENVANSNVEMFNRFFHSMLDAGVYLAPSAFEAGFVSTTHDAAALEATLKAAEISFAGLA